MIAPAMNDIVDYILIYTEKLNTGGIERISGIQRD
jgi:hypothetical protein